ncbi:MAG TPA: hypothetical protein VFS00_06435 [Polyangiaceae bacterium]|nr:hypothetical protein [Polyangiaceae bacterium]
MDAIILPAIIDQATSAIITLIVFTAPLGLVYMLRSFRLREKELDLRRMLAARPRDEEIAALEERLSRLESDRLFFDRLAERTVQGAAPRAGFGAKARVPDLVEAGAGVDASAELDHAALYASNRSLHAR